MQSLPEIVEFSTWRAPRETLLVEEQAATRARDALAELWEESPEGWPQTAPYQWWRRHDEYHAGERTEGGS